jgi:RNA polymerase primary sigma factor
MVRTNTATATLAMDRRSAEEAGKACPALSGMGPLTAEELALYVQIPDKIDYVTNPSFALKATEERLFGENVKVEVPSWTYFGDTVEDELPNSTRRISLDLEDERILFLRFNYARYRLSPMIDAQRKRETTVRARQMLFWYRRMQEARANLVQANMGLVLAMAKRSRIASVEFSELVSEGNMALLRSVEKFDISRGFRFSTYACRAILKSFSRMASKCGRYRQRFPTEYDPELERSDQDIRRHQAQAEDTLDSLRRVLADNRARLTEIEQRIIWARFAIDGGGRKRTLSQVGQIVGLSNERVRQIQSLALRKIRAALEDSYLPG